MLEGLTVHVDAIRDYLNSFFDGKIADLESGSVPVAGAFDVDVLRRLKDYAVRGKLLRGALVFLGYDAVGGNPQLRMERCLPAAAAMELTQSFLLIHDDIMDKDEVRRGAPSLHRQYREFAESRGIAESEHLGMSLGICIGDVAMFLALELLSKADPSLLGSYAQELNLVGLAQMDDVYFGQADEEPTVDRVVQVYRFKTGRYTFSLPLALGAFLGGGRSGEAETLARFGEELGVVFQIKDDEIGIFGEADHIGKPAGSDITANKKTVFRQLLIERQAPPEAMAFFGDDGLGAADVAQVRDAIRRLGVLEAAERLASGHRNEAVSALDAVVGAGHPARPTFEALISFNDERTR